MSITFHLLHLWEAISHKLGLVIKNWESIVNISRQNTAVRKAFLPQEKEIFFEWAFNTKWYAVIFSISIGVILFSATKKQEIISVPPIKETVENLKKEEKIETPLIKVSRQKTETENSIKSNLQEKVEPELVKAGEDISLQGENKSINSIFKGQKYVLLASKQNKKLIVGRNSDNGTIEILKKFTASFGKATGDKKIEGDLKTPEGMYKIVKVKPKRELTKIFGPMAFVLNYPNERDKKKGKTGSNIWIHGTGTNAVTPDTKGCVEISDEDILDIKKYIGIDTPIVIFPEQYNIVKTIQDDTIRISVIKDILLKEAKI